MIIGLCKHTTGHKINFKNTWSYFTGYYQFEGGRYYWQLDTPQGITWTKLPKIPVKPNYETELTM